MFEKITKRPNVWRFIKNNINQGNLTFVLKNEAQALEVKKISSMARWIFHIVLNCPFVPVAYISLLAVLMTTKDKQEFESSSVCLNNGIIVDLLLKEGAITLQSNVEETEIIYPEHEAAKKNNEQQKSDQADKTSGSKYKEDQIWQDDSTILADEVPPTTFLHNVGQHIEDEIWFNQTRIHDDIKMNNIKEDKNVLKNIKSNRLNSGISAIIDESNIYQTPESIYSSNSSIQTIPNDEMHEILGDQIKEWHY
jgi:hypothetical protein